jgi:hypothetical protein
MRRSDIIALLLSLLAVLAGYLVHDRIFERLAHIEDEMAYVWQAQAIAGGHLSLPSPPEPKSFLYPFVVDYNGQRFGKYPLGWPVLLAIGERFQFRFLVNPLLGGLGVWLTYRLGKKVFGAPVGLLAAFLTLTSPFFLMNTGSLLSHPFGLVLSAAFALAWLDSFCSPQSARPWLASLVAGGTLGALVLTRPFTALAVALPFGLHGLYLLARGDRPARRRLIVIGLIVLGLACLHFVWQYALTGDARLNPYTLWWPYDKVGFGPGTGRAEEGHTLNQAWINTRYSLRSGYYDLFGWGSFSWIFLPVGLLVTLRDRNWRSLLLGSVFISLLLAYMAYWIGASLFGPRYYYEGLYSLTLFTAAGVAWLAGWPTQPGVPFPNYSGWRRWRALAVTSLVALLVSANLIYYTPMRLSGMFGLYGVQRAHMQPFMSPEAQEFTPALVIVHTKHKWIEYGTLLELENPYLNTPFIFIIDRGEAANETVADHFPDRAVFYYYPLDEPYILFTGPLPEQ